MHDYIIYREDTLGQVHYLVDYVNCTWSDSEEDAYRFDFTSASILANLYGLRVGRVTEPASPN